MSKLAVSTLKPSILQITSTCHTSSGISNFLSSYASITNGLDFKSYKNVIEALTDMGLIEEAKVLTAFENDSSQENTDIYYYNLALNNDYESFWDKVYSYADQNIKR